MLMRICLFSVMTMILALVSSCASTTAQNCDKTTPPPQQPAAAAGIPAFPLEALQGPHAKSAKLYVKTDGTIRKYTVYVERAAIPDWVHAMADKEIGKGEDVEFEVEQYENGDKVYEVTRLVDGKKVELAVSVDRKKLYTEVKDLPLESLPAPLKKTADGIAGFTLKSWETKEKPSGKIHELHGELEGKPYTLYVADDGTIQSRRTQLPAKLNVER